MQVNSNISITALGVLVALALIPGAASASPDLQLCNAHGLVRGAEIAMEKGCYGCHTLNSKRVGPPYRDVAARYGRHAAVLSTLATKIRDGGSGVWGDVAMPPSAISHEEAEVLARWIQSL